MKKTFPLGGIHPAEHKKGSREITLQELPMVATLPLSQHIGAPARPTVERGAHVDRGDLIADTGSFVSARLHAPISGTVAAIDNIVMPDGRPAKAITIKATAEEHVSDSELRRGYWAGIGDCAAVPEGLSAEDVRQAISSAGIVGLGGATFPAHVKAATPAGAAEVLIINGCECEPYLTCDDALMRTYPRQTVGGVELLMLATGAPRAVIAIEDNKPEAIAAIKAAAETARGVEVTVLRTKYPQGGEKQLIAAVTGRRPASGALPLSVGAVVNNVATAFAVWQAVARNMPLIERIVTVTGDIAPEQQRNYMVALGTPLSELPFTLPDDCRAIVGGPMMGRTAVRLDASVCKGTSGLLLLENRLRRPEQACVRCGRCVDVCPMGLEPYLLSVYGRLRRWEEARQSAVADCIECGSCSYICPSSRPLLDYIRIAKQRSK